MAIKPGYESYARLAEILTDKYHLDPPMDRRRVYAWARRGVKNKNGEKFPGPAGTIPAKSRKPHNLFSVEQVIAWYDGGPPAGWHTGQE
jgi:hypothetical protein